MALLGRETGDVAVLEVERKLTVDTGFAMPALSAPNPLPDGSGAWVLLGAVPTELDATYYDTTDLRLAAAHMTLRRRTGGKDPGWHLKLPLEGEREEIQRPLGRAKKVPRELSDLVLARTRGQALVPVARIRTTRTVTTVHAGDGTPLVEVADDQVVGERLGDELVVTRWREIEAELLTPGQEKSLAEVVDQLRAAGAQPSPSASKLSQTLGGPTGARASAATPPRADQMMSTAQLLASALAEQVEALTQADPRVRRDQHDAVHAMRVASRRLRSTLHTFRPLLDVDALGDLEEELKWLAGILGEVRDREVLHERLRGQLDALPVELVLGPVRERLLDTELRAGQLKARTATLAVLNGARYLSLLDHLDSVAAAPPVTADAALPAVITLPRLVKRAWKRLDGRAARALASGDDQDLHDTRKAAKQARYTAEAVTPVLGRRAARLGDLAKRLQTVLGDHQDAVVARTLLRRIALDELQAFTYGLLYAEEHQRALAAAAEFRHDWKRADRAAGRRLVTKLQ